MMTTPPPSIHPIIVLGFFIPMAIAAAICYFIAKREYDRTIRT
jgi:hypothetical protein